MISAVRTKGHTRRSTPASKQSRGGSTICSAARSAKEKTMKSEWLVTLCCDGTFDLVHAVAESTQAHLDQPRLEPCAERAGPGRRRYPPPLARAGAGSRPADPLRKRIGAPLM